MLDRHEQVYGHYPLNVALDGGFASKTNLKAAKSEPRHIKNVCFAKSRGLKEEDMCQSSWVYKRLRRFRAGIESGISWLKRSFGFSRCTWKSIRIVQELCVVLHRLGEPIHVGERAESGNIAKELKI